MIGCRNHYADVDAACPMVFLGTQFWEESGVWNVIKTSSLGRPYHDLLLLSDDTQEVLLHFVKYRNEKKLPVFTEASLRLPDHRKKSSSLLHEAASVHY